MVSIIACCSHYYCTYRKRKQQLKLRWTLPFLKKSNEIENKSIVGVDTATKSVDESKDKSTVAKSVPRKQRTSFYKEVMKAYNEPQGYNEMKE